MTKIDAEDIKKEKTEEAGAQENASQDVKDEDARKGQSEGTTGEKTEEAEASPDKKDADEDSDTRYLRLMADFQNYKKRVEKEKTDLYSYANEKLITEMLEVLDNFERALDQEGQGDSFKKGMEMIFKQLGDVLKKSGLAEIPALGEEFDPNFHNAVMSEETDDYESGKVSGVMQKGYTLNGKVIRPSMVKVAG